MYYTPNQKLHQSFDIWNGIPVGDFERWDDLRSNPGCRGRHAKTGLFYAFDPEREAVVYLADSNEENPAGAGEWETVPADRIGVITGFQNWDWNGKNTPYVFERAKDGGWKCVA